MPCIATVCVKIILCDPIRDGIHNCDTSMLKKKFPVVLLFYIYKEKKRKEKRSQANLVLNNQKIYIYLELNVFVYETKYTFSFYILSIYFLFFHMYLERIYNLHYVETRHQKEADK